MGEATESDGGTERYPPYVETDEQRRRWDLAQGLARLLFDAARSRFGREAVETAPYRAVADGLEVAHTRTSMIY